MQKRFILPTLFCLTAALSYAGEPDSLLYSNHIFDSRIKTVLLYKEGWNLSYPVIKLNDNEKLVLEFDLIDDRMETYYYSIIHCDKDWNKSDIIYNEYLDGFPDNPVEDCEPSFNTTVNYFHYKVVFPNDRITFRKSGNYIINLYPSGYPEKPALVQRFVVTEDLVDINITMHRPQLSADDNARQQVDFTVMLRNSGIIDPDINIYSFVLQNGRWDNAKRNLKPVVFGNNELIYNSLSDKNIFMGGNEFRYFDITSVKYQSEYIKKIDFIPPNYCVWLYPSENREFKPYFYWKDFNGKYYIATQEGQDPGTDADYFYVYFSLPSKQPVEGGQMYVSGDLSDWELNGDNRMTYDSGKGEYEGLMLLKQGWYNYEYMFLKDGSHSGVATKFEGSHYQTENDYQVIVYYRSPFERYDRVAGTATANTLNRMAY